FAETKEQLGGIGVLEARDMIHAVELMSKHPGLHYGAAFEIRPIDEESLKWQEAVIAGLQNSTADVAADAASIASLGYINEGNSDSMAKGERDALLERCHAFHEATIKNGQWLTGVALQSVRTAKTLRARAGQVVVTDGPFTETKECLGGVVVLTLK